MVRILPLSVHNIFYTFKQIIQFKHINSYRQADMYQLFYSKVLIANLNELQFLSKSIENRDPENQFNFGHCNTTISYYKYFLKKEFNSDSGKKAFMESKTVMLINSVLMTTLIPLNLKI